MTGETFFGITVLHWL